MSVSSFRYSVVTSAGPSTPALVQHVSSASNPAGFSVSGDNFIFTPPNPVGAHNCIELKISFPSGHTATITDNNGNTWPGSPAVSADSGSMISAIFVLPNANIGRTFFTISFGTRILPVQYTYSEWSGIALSSPVNGTSSAANVIGSSLATGSFTPTTNNDANGGNIISAYYALSSTSAASNPSTWVAGGSFTLLDANIGWVDNKGFPTASQYLIQSTQASINPSITTTGDTTDHFNCVAVALKAAPAGTPSPSTGIYVNKIIHTSNDLVPPVGT